MVLKFKKRNATTNLKKVMVYGHDGTGKSTFAENYCKENNLNPVVIDIDDTNYTDLPILELDFGSDVKTFNQMKQAISEISKSDEFDTIILDGVTSLLEMLVSNAKGLAKYSDRATRFQKILQLLLSSGKHLIFIGQADMEVIFTEDFQSSKMVIKINSIVNEKYCCYVDDKGNYTYEVMKFRKVKSAPKPEPKVEPTVTRKEPVIKEKVSRESELDDFVTADEIGEPDPEDDPVRNQCILIKNMLVKEGRAITKFSMRMKVIQLIENEVLPAENQQALCNYINEHCPEGVN
jgi:adenosyl cobinamide kinase/adenosyl cobinamide phosphate guanylyltransferase